MKKYLGTWISLYGAIAWPIICMLPLVLAIIVGKEAPSSEIVPTIVLVAMCLVAEIVLIKYSIDLDIPGQFYSWGYFRGDGVEIKSPFRKKYVIEYSKCADIGVGYYIHGVLNSKIGSKVIFIYLSYNKIGESHKRNMNLLHPSGTFVKLAYSEKLSQFLLKALPKPQRMIFRENCRWMELVSDSEKSAQKGNKRFKKHGG